ncbi:MAG: heme lyase CcmF/NrfE family subunit [Chloroflexi bacterium]|nr:heme lyase CcmF/NrfE family subunit [Chloroflexota bacterium]
MTDLGYASLLWALLISIYGAAAAFLGGRFNHQSAWQSAQRSLFASFGLITVAAAVLLYALLSRDFEVEYVAQYTDRALPLIYTISAFYAGNQGSLLLWAWLVSLFGIIFLLQNRRRLPDLMPYAITVILCTQVFFLILVTMVSNPFQRLPVPPPDGQGLNPLLENMGMLFHPPTLYLGYVGFTIPYALAMAALITGRLGDEWIRAIRRWTLFSWLLLAAGNLFGGQWAYVELGWGGYWAWDPVENAGLLPWLTGTAFLHSVMIQRRRGMLKVWNMILIILSFLLSIFGTFLTRSGVLSSVHTFSESALGPFFMAFLGMGLLVSLGLLINRWDDLRGEEELDSLVSRESSFLFNNLILVGAAFATFWGTIFPLISEAVRGVKITVGPPFFNSVNGPIFLVLILIMGICPLIGWRRASTNNLMRNFLYPFVGAGIVTAVLWALGLRESFALIGFALCAFVLVTIFSEWYRGVRARHRNRGENYLAAFINLLGANKPRYGGYIVHLSVIIIAVGVLASSFYKVEKEVNLRPGETMNIKNYVLRFEGRQEYNTASKKVTAATLSVSNGEKPLGTIVSEKYTHRNHPNPVTEVGIRSTLWEDLYVILGGWGQDDSATFKVLVNPLVIWIWIGSVLMGLGTLVAAWPEGKSPLNLPEEQK